MKNAYIQLEGRDFWDWVVLVAFSFSCMVYHHNIPRYLLLTLLPCLLAPSSQLTPLLLSSLLFNSTCRWSQLCVIVITKVISYLERRHYFFHYLLGLPSVCSSSTLVNICAPHFYANVSCLGLIELFIFFVKLCSLIQWPISWFWRKGDAL